MARLGPSSWKITKIILTKTIRAVEQCIIIPLVHPWRRDSSLRSRPGDDSEHSSQMMIAYSTARDGQIFRVWSGSLVASVVAWRSDDLWRNTAAAALIHLEVGVASYCLLVSSGRVGVFTETPSRNTILRLPFSATRPFYVNTSTRTPLWDFSYKDNWTIRSEKDGSTIFRLGRIFSA